MFGHHRHHHHHHPQVDRADLDFGTLGSRAIFQYWSDLANVSVALLENQTFGWVGLWQAAATGTLDRYELARLTGDILSSSLSTVVGLTAFPFEWSIRRLMSTPSIVFMVDGWSQSVGPESAPTAITVPAGMLVASTDLQMVNSSTPASPVIIPASNVRVVITSGGNRVQVSLVDLSNVNTNANNNPNPAGNTLLPGFYVGAVYAVEAPNRRPLALIYVNVDRTGGPP